MSALIPGPSEEGLTNNGDTGDGGSRCPDSGGPRKSQILDAQKCMEALSQMPGMIALGLLTPSRANSMLGTYKAILNEHKWVQLRDGKQQKTLPEDLLDLARKDPKIANLLEPLLTQEQIDLLLKGAQEGGDGAI